MLRAIAVFLANIYYHVMYSIKVTGKDSLKDLDNYILCSNHISNLDPPLLSTVFDKKLRFMAKEELFKNKIIAFFLKSFGAFAVKRGSGDIGAIKAAFSILKNGDNLLMFPEGHRSKTGELGDFKTGAVMIAVKAGVPILPVGISGEYKLRKVVSINIGKPIYLSELSGRKLTSEELQTITDDVLKKQIYALSNGEAPKQIAP